jgi:hypothetical protein
MALGLGGVPSVLMATLCCALEAMAKSQKPKKRIDFI